MLLFVFPLITITNSFSQQSDLGSIGNPALSASHLKAIHPEKTDGLYWIDPDGPGDDNPFMSYFDQSTDGEGWTLVLLSNAGVANCPRPYWNELTGTSDLNLNGSLSSDITTFDMFMKVPSWNLVGNSARLDMGASPSSLSHRAYYDFSLDEDNFYALEMSNESLTIHTEGTASPGIFTYHNGRPLSTRDSDHDAWSGNCSNNYYESAWWYGACMTGSFWGGGGETYQDGPYWDGSATEFFEFGAIWLKESWIPVSNVSDLQNMRNDLSANYYLTNDIDASETSTWNSDGSGGYYGFEPVGNEVSPFTGRFDGAGYSIKGLYMNRSGDEGVGLFGYFDGTDIRNIVLQNIDITGGSNYVGSLAGLIKGGKISACNAQGLISVSGDFVGGITGYNEGGMILNSYACVAVKGASFIGGLAGSNGGSIDKCYSMGPLSGLTNIGGLAGANSGTVSNSFWDIHTSGISSGTAGTGKSPLEMQNLATYTALATNGLDDAWDFIANPNDDSGDQNLWAIDTSINGGYPYLSVQKSTGNIIFVDHEAAGDGTGSSWTNAYNSLQNALMDDDLWYGVNIWVAEGTYYPDDGSDHVSGDRTASFSIPDGVHIYGGFAGTESSLAERDPDQHITILSGDIGVVDAPADNSFHVVKGGNNTLLNGLIIEKGNASGAGDPDYFGGGMFNDANTQNILIEHCTFRENNASSQGGAVYNNGYVTITTRHTVFYKNTAADNATVKNVNTEADYYYCTFIENADASMGGGLMYWGSGSGSPDIHNCTFIRNQSAAGGAIHLRASGINADIRNCIFYHNTPDDIALTNGATSNVSYSRIIQSPYTGSQNNIADDPLFADTIYGALSLYNLSPCIDAGDENSPADPDGSRANMGDFHPLVPSPLTPSFSVSPEVASCGVTMEFNASASTALPAHEISSYEWDFDYDGVNFDVDTTGEVVPHQYERMNFSGSGESITVLPYTVALRLSDNGVPPFTMIKTGEATLSFTNQAPVANAGGDYYSTNIGGSYTPVRLDASDSYDPDIPCDEIESYDWDTDGDGLYGADDMDGSPMIAGGNDASGESLDVLDAGWVIGQSIPISLVVTDAYGRKSPGADAIIHVVENSNFPADVYNLEVDPINRDTLWFSFTVTHPQQMVDTFACSFTVNGTPVTVFDTYDIELSEIRYEGYNTEQSYTAWFDSHDFPDMVNAYQLRVSVEGDESVWESSDLSGLFSIDNTPPSNPTFCSEPGSMSEVCTNNPLPVFTWSGALDNSSATLEYMVYWGTDISGESPSELLTVNQFTPDPLLGNGVYYLRINTLDESGNEAGWITLYTFVFLDYVYSETTSICHGDSLLWRGEYYLESGIYRDSLLTAGGCDSVFELDLSVFPSYSIQESHSMCGGDIFAWQGTDYTIPGDYSHAYSTISGCDSIYYLHLIVLEESVGDTSAIACDSFEWYGTTYSASGDYTHILTNAAGCDSVVSLHLTIQTANLVVYVNDNVLSADATGVVYQWVNCDDDYSEINLETNQTFSPVTSGNYAVIIDDGICVDTSECYHVEITGMETFSENNIQVYPNPFEHSSTILFENPDGEPYDLYIITLEGKTTRIINTIRTSEYVLQKGDLKEGIYFIELRGTKIYRAKIIII